MYTLTELNAIAQKELPNSKPCTYPNCKCRQHEGAMWFVAKEKDGEKGHLNIIENADDSHESCFKPFKESEGE